MRSVLRCAALVGLLCIGPFAPAQESRGPAEETQQLFDSTIARDIATAGFYELVAWLESLGLSIRGDRAALVARLAGHYGVAVAAIDDARGVSSDEQPSGRSIFIDSATRTRYFTVEEVDETNIRLAGGVIITLRDEDRGGVHRIEADEIVLNETQGTLTASGSVVYTLERDGSTERFSGEALTVELESFSGGFVRGVTERERTIEGEAIDFEFAGTYITRSRDDVIVLEDGRITSSKADPPNYHISAQKIWVLAPGEWGLRNAALYVGRIPMFYIPFFFRPGNELFSNPSVGTREREGAYIQTTTYLIGKPEERDSPFSLLQLADEPGTQSERRREGLFLVPDTEAQPTAPARPDSDTLRLLADVYTKLGAYVGIDATIAEALPLRQLNLSMALAATRHVYQYSTIGTAYSPYFISDGRYADSWNSSRFLGTNVPFRFGVAFRSVLGAPPLRTDLQFNLYSDTRFRTDFGARAEEIDWLGLIGPSEPLSPPPPVTSLLWQVSAAFTPNVASLRPYVQQLAVQPLLASLRYASRDIETALLTPEVTLADASPERSFFYPTSMRLPELSARLGGTLVEYPARRPPAAATTADPRPELVPPWEADTPLEESGQEAPTGPSAPPLLSSLPSPNLASPSSGSLAYSASTTTIVDHEFDSSTWKSADDVDFGIQYRSASTRANASVNWRSSIASGVFSAEGSLAAAGQQRSVFDRADSVPDPTWDALLNQAWRFGSFSTTHNFTARARPFALSALWGASTVAYTSNLLLYRYVFDRVENDSPIYRSEPIEWDDAGFFRAHQVEATAALTVLRNSQQLAVAAALPPLDERYTGRLSLRVDPARLTVTTGSTLKDDDWLFDPLNAALDVALCEASATNTLSYDLNDQELTLNRTRLAYGGLFGEFEARLTEGYDFGGPGIGWVADGDRELRPFRAEVGVTTNNAIGPAWKNRMTGMVQSQFRMAANLLRFTESSLSLTLTSQLNVHEFVAIRLRMTSGNNQIYIYVPALAEEVGRPPRNLVDDLLRSVNFFSVADRRRSEFNLQQIELSAVHDLDDWELTVGYQARPELTERDDGPNVYELRGVFTLNLQWRPIRELRAGIRDDGDELSFETDP